LRGARLARLAVLGAVVVALVSEAPAAAATALPVWPAASELALPPGANTKPGEQRASLRSTSCPSPGVCVAVGSYTDTGSDDRQAMAAAATGGAWGRASELKLPTGANTTPGKQDAVLDSVSCTSPGDCVAVGFYTDTNGSDDTQAMVAEESGGVWARASKLTLPTGANTAAGKQFAVLDSVTCTSPGDCVAVGGYQDEGESRQAMIATESAGVWAKAHELELPTGAETVTGDQDAALESVACTGAGSCVAVGFYSDGNSVDGEDVQTMSAAETGGAWGRASELVLPGGAEKTLGEQQAKLAGVTCTSAGNCVAVGDYTDESHDDEAMLATETGGAWAQASELTPPPGAEAATGDHNAVLHSVTCTSLGDCVAVGSYKAAIGAVEAMSVTATGGAWAQASERALPPEAEAGSNQDAGLSSVTCMSAGSCVAVGSNDDSSGSEQAMTVSAVPTLAVATASPPAAIVGVAYSAQLAATGGAGTYTWALSAGALPAGLTLNSATGVISGTPTTATIAKVTVSVGDPGPPAQQASAALSLSVNQGPALISAPRPRPAAPNTLLTKEIISSRHRSAQFSFKAVGEATGFQCALVRVPHGKHKKLPAPHYTSCFRAKKYTHLSVGHYIFYVRAIGPGGADRTPATHKFAIV